MKKRFRGGKKTPEGEKLNLSKTQFITYLGCPRQYYLKYHRGWTEPSDKENFLKGNAIHDFWENMYEDYCDIKNGQIKITGELSDKQLQYYDAIRNMVDFEQRRYNKVVKKKGLDPEEYFFPISVEEKFQVNGLRGLPDAIYRKENGNLEVFDLKYSLYSGWKHKFEILFYAKLVDMSGKFDAPVTSGMLLSASDGNLEYYNFDKFDLLEFESRIEEVREGINSGKFPACGKNWCNWDYSPPEDATRKPERIRR